MFINISTKKSKLDLNAEETKRFIANYLSHETFWNVAHADYAPRDERNAVLVAI